jgi:hypothetical protein
MLLDLFVNLRIVCKLVMLPVTSRGDLTPYVQQAYGKRWHQYNLRDLVRSYYGD